MNRYAARGPRDVASGPDEAEVRKTMTMDLIFGAMRKPMIWTEGCDDMQRSLTARGEKQAKRMASWLDRQLPDGTHHQQPRAALRADRAGARAQYKLRTGELAPRPPPMHWCWPRPAGPTASRWC